MYTFQEIVENIKNFESSPDLVIKPTPYESFFSRLDLCSCVKYSDVFTHPANGNDDLISERVRNFIGKYMFAGITVEQLEVLKDKDRHIAFFTSKDPDFAEKENTVMTFHKVYGEEFLKKKGFDELGLIDPDLTFVTMITTEHSVLSFRPNPNAFHHGRHPAPKVIQ